MVRRILLAGRLARHAMEGVAVAESDAARRADHGVLQISTDVRELDSGGGGFLVFQRPLLNRAVNLAQVVDTGVLLGLCAGADEIGNGDGSQKADDSHYDHDFHQGEACGARCSAFHTCFVFFLCSRRELASGGLL